MSQAVKFNKPKKKPQAENVVIKDNQPSFLPIRFWVIVAFISVLVLTLVAKAFYLQVIDSDRLISEANNRSIRTTKLNSTRGKILDRDGRLLAISVPMYALTIDPKEYFDHKLFLTENQRKQLVREMGKSKGRMEESIRNFLNRKVKPKRYDPEVLFNIQGDGYWQLLAKATGFDYQELVQTVRNNPNSTFVQVEKQNIQFELAKWKELAKHLELKYTDVMDKLYKNSEQRFLYIARHQLENTAEYAKKLKLVGFVLRTEYRRFYPLAEEISQLIGFTDVEDKKGIEGLERSFDSLLIGQDGKKVIRRDKRGNVIEELHRQDQYNPQDVALSIDEELQSMVYQEIKKSVIENKAESGTAVLVDIHTGEILAMANAPSFNPNNRSEFKSELARNRAITDTFEPGSTVKPLVVLTALQNKVTYMSEVIDTRPFVVNGHTIRDVSYQNSLTLTGILQKSSNVGVSRLALRMPSTALVETYSKVGFGKDTGLGLGEQKGKNGDRKRWADIERATLSYGYGLEVTPLQLARAYATLGSFGVYRPLSITKVDPPVLGDRVLPEKITREVVHMMESVAQKGEGGQRAAVDGYRVAIKTGTARKIEKGKYVEKYIAYTAGIAPASDPRFALVVLINEPKAGQYYGGAISAPLFSKIMSYTLKTKNIKPDGE